MYSRSRMIGALGPTSIAQAPAPPGVDLPCIEMSTATTIANRPSQLADSTQLMALNKAAADDPGVKLPEI